MRVNAKQNEGISFAVLSADGRERIVLSAMEVLEQSGARFYEPEAVGILAEAGAQVEDDTLVRVPASLVKGALDTVPPRFSLYTRDGRPAIRVEPGTAHFGPGPTCCNYVDPYSGERRLFVKADAASTARACDALPNIDYAMSLGSISDVPQDQADVHEFDAMVRETTKPIMSWSFSLESLETIHLMCVAVKGSVEEYARAPFMIFYAEPSSPLRHSAEALQKLIYCARHRIPMVYTPCPIAGGTAPATMAGVLVQNLAETLAGVVLSQLIRPGTPIVVGGVVSILDMRTTILSYGAPELALLSAGATEVARHLGLPMFSTAGCTDSKCLDGQATLEAAMSILTAVLSGANFVHDVGYAESGLTGSLRQLVAGDEIIGMSRHIARGIRVDDDTVAVEVIAEAAESGNYLALDHTARHFRDQFWFPTLLDRTRFGEWEAEGALRFEDRAEAKVREILDSHRAPALEESIGRRLDEIVAG